MSLDVYSQLNTPLSSNGCWSRYAVRMGHYPFTLFNGVTAMVLVLALVLVWRRFRGSLRANWPLACYAAIAGYTFGFSASLNPYWVAAGLACGVAIRLDFHPRQVRWAEAIALGYVVWRCVGLLLMW
jgi:chromate transport protein ChrA